jgi:hypothetical protein
MCHGFARGQSSSSMLFVDGWSCSSPRCMAGTFRLPFPIGGAKAGSPALGAR